MNIQVTNIEELYKAINVPANAGNTLILTPNTYKLDASKANNGRLEFLQNMTIRGVVGRSDKVIIDASALPESSFSPPNNLPARRTGAIRMGRGLNKLEWVKVIGSPTAAALSAIDTDLVTTGVSLSQIRIEHCIVTKSRIGIDIRNVGSSSDNRIIEADILFNELVENDVSDPNTQQGQGIVFQNANGVKGGMIKVTMKGNYIHHNTIGTRIFNNNGNPGLQIHKNSIRIQSNDDRFEENKLAMHVIGGYNSGANSSAIGNLISLDAKRTSVMRNKGIMPDAIVTPCGILVVGGSRSNNDSAVSSNNEVELKFTDCSISDNQNVDLIAYGAFSTTSAIAGTSNIVKIQLSGKSKSATVTTFQSKPPEPAGTNVVMIRKV